MPESSSILLTPIAHVIQGRHEPVDDRWGTEIAVVELTADFSPDALLGLDAFSHAEFVFHFHLVLDHNIERTARHPRNNAAWPRVGIFAQRGKNRPNCLGVSIARILSIAERKITVEGLDAIEGTPILDIKPVLAEFLPQGNIRQPDWSHELMRHYWK